MKTQRIVFLFFIIGLLSCTTVSGPVHVYPGEPRPRNETARLQVPGPITVVKVDGKEVDVPSIEDGFYQIYLLPGLHRIDFRYELSWGDNLSAMLVKSDIVGVESQFFAGKNYELTYPQPADLDDAYQMTRNFKVKMIEIETGRQVASRSSAELNELKTSAPLSVIATDTIPSAPKTLPTAETFGTTVPADIKAETAVHEDAVKRLKFWWLMANEEERKLFMEWQKSVKNVK